MNNTITFTTLKDAQTLYCEVGKKFDEAYRHCESFAQACEGCYELRNEREKILKLVLVQLDMDRNAVEWVYKHSGQNSNLMNSALCLLKRFKLQIDTAALETLEDAQEAYFLAKVLIQDVPFDQRQNAQGEIDKVLLFICDHFVGSDPQVWQWVKDYSQPGSSSWYRANAWLNSGNRRTNPWRESGFYGSISYPMGGEGYGHDCLQRYVETGKLER